MDLQEWSVERLEGLFPYWNDLQNNLRNLYNRDIFTEEEYTELSAIIQRHGEPPAKTIYLFTQEEAVKNANKEHKKWTKANPAPSYTSFSLRNNSYKTKVYRDYLKAGKYFKYDRKSKTYTLHRASTEYIKNTLYVNRHGVFLEQAYTSDIARGIEYLERTEYNERYKEWSTAYEEFLEGNEVDRGVRPNPSYIEYRNDIFEAMVLYLNRSTRSSILNLVSDDFKNALEVFNQEKADNPNLRKLRVLPLSSNDDINSVYNLMSISLLNSLDALIRTMFDSRLFFILNFRTATPNPDGYGFNIGAYSGLNLNPGIIESIKESSRNKKLTYLEDYDPTIKFMTEVTIEVREYNPITRKPRKGLFFKYYVKPTFFTEAQANKDCEPYMFDTLLKYNIFCRGDKKFGNQPSCLHKAIFESIGVAINYARGANDSLDVGITELTKIANENNIRISLKDPTCSNRTILGDNEGPIARICRLDNHYFVNEKLPNKHYCIPYSSPVKYFTTSYSIVEYLLTEEGRKYLEEIPFEDVAKVISHYVEDKVKEGYYLTDRSLENTYKKAKYMHSLPEDPEYVPLSEKVFDRCWEDDICVEVDADFETSTNEGIHYPICCTAIDDCSPYVHRFYGEDCAKQFVDYLVQIHTDNDHYIASASRNNKTTIDGKAADIATFKIDPNAPINYPEWMIRKYGYKRMQFKGRAQPLAIRVYFFNLGYDKSFLCEQFDEVYNYMGSGKNCKGFTGKLDMDEGPDICIYFRDAMALLTGSLASVPETYAIPNEDKGAIPYHFYNRDSMNPDHPDTTTITIEQWEKVLDVMPPSSRTKFIDYANEKGYLVYNENSVIFYHKEAMMDYCENDVKLQRLGRLSYNKGISETSTYIPRPHQDYTNSGVARSVVTASGQYDGCVELHGEASEYVRQGCYGGVTMLKNNRKQHYIGKLTYSDQNSLYPSAMIALGGVPVGLPKRLYNLYFEPQVFDEETCDFISGIECLHRRIKTDYNFACSLRVKILNLPFKPGITFLFRQNGVEREYTNNITPDNPLIFMLSKQTWLLLTEFYGCVPGVDFTLIDGLMWEKRSNSMAKSMGKPYWARKKYQVEGNKARAAVLKLVLNSIWGKDMQKTYHDVICIKRASVLDEELHNSGNRIHKFSAINEDKSLMLVKHFTKKIPKSRAHVSQETLGMAKYIMWRWHDAVYKSGGDILYSDTDSSIMPLKDYHNAVKYFKEKYGFSPDGDDEEYGDRKNPPGTMHPEFDEKNTSHASEYIGIAKKVYWIECVRIDGTKYESFKFKGVTNPKQTILYYCSTLGITVKEFFLSLLRGEAHTIPMIYKHSKPMFKLDPKTWQYSSLIERYSTFQFEGEIDYYNENEQEMSKAEGKEEEI